MTLRLTLIRHGSTRGTAARRYEGSLDPPLSPAGEAEARAVGPRVADREFDAVWSSDLRRATRTAELIFGDQDVVLDERLRELDLGTFEGHTHEANLARHGDAYRRWIDDPARCPPPGGESLHALRSRVGSWLAELPSGGRVAAVSHGGTIRAAVTIAEGIPFRRARDIEIPPCGIVDVKWNGATP